MTPKVTWQSSHAKKSKVALFSEGRPHEKNKMQEGRPLSLRHNSACVPFLLVFSSKDYFHGRHQHSKLFFFVQYFFFLSKASFVSYFGPKRYSCYRTTLDSFITIKGTKTEKDAVKGRRTTWKRVVEKETINDERVWKKHTSSKREHKKRKAQSLRSRIKLSNWQVRGNAFP